METTKKRIPYITEELIEEILSRLPVKDLMRLKSVSRSWNNLISGTRFCNVHLKRSMMDHNHTKIMHMCDDPTTDQDLFGRLCFLAHCNGLFCMYIDEAVLFWNPSTKQTRKVPPRIQFPSIYFKSQWGTAVFGLGHHPASDDYILVRISSQVIGISLSGHVDFTNHVQIYSRNRATWRKILDLPYHFLYQVPGVFANGCLHWIVSMGNVDVQDSQYEDLYLKAAAINLDNESCDLISLPGFNWMDSRLPGIESLHEKMTFFYSSNDGTFNLWLLRAESWTWIKIEADFVNMYMEEACFSLQPICIPRSGQIVLLLGYNKLVIWDVDEKPCIDIYSPFVLKGCGVECRMVSYVETLVSPGL